MNGGKTMTVKDFVTITCTTYQEIRINEYEGDRHTGNRWVIEKGDNYAGIIPENILNREVITIVPYFSGISVEIEAKETPLHTYRIQYTETYSKIYDVRGTSYENAKDMLLADIAKGKENGPEECINSKCELIDIL